MIRYRDLNIAAKTLIPIISSFIIIVFVLLFYVLPQVKDTIFEQKKEGLRNVVELAYTIFQGLDKKVAAGEITLQEAQAEAKRTIKFMRFEKKNYYFVFDYDKMVIQPVSPAREGKTLDFFKDDNKTEYLLEGAKLCKESGEGFIFYYRAKPNTETPLPKISFVREYKPWNWIIGAGVYFDDIDLVYSEIKTDILSVFFVIMVLLIIILVVSTQKYFLKPIKQLRSAAEQIALGDFSSHQIYDSKDEFGKLTIEFDKMTENINKLIAETTKASGLASEGKLDYRSNPDNYSGAFKQVLIGLNETMNGIIQPLNVAAEYVDRISKGDIPPLINDNYKGDFNEIKNNINLLIDTFTFLINDIDILNNEIIAGNLRYRINTDKHNGKFKEIIKGINASLDRLVDVIDKIPLPIRILDKESKIKYCNEV